MKTEEEKDRQALHENTRKYLDMLSKRPYPYDLTYEAELNRMDNERTMKLLTIFEDKLIGR